MNDFIQMEVLNPRGEVPPVNFQSPKPRVDTLEGKRIGLFWNGKAGADLFMDVVSEMLHNKYPGAEIKRFEGPLNPPDDLVETVAEQSDAVIYGIGD